MLFAAVGLGIGVLLDAVGLGCKVLLDVGDPPEVEEPEMVVLVIGVVLLVGSTGVS